MHYTLSLFNICSSLLQKHIIVNAYILSQSCRSSIFSEQQSNYISIVTFPPFFLKHHNYWTILLYESFMLLHLRCSKLRLKLAESLSWMEDDKMLLFNRKTVAPSPIHLWLYTETHISPSTLNSVLLHVMKSEVFQRE